MDRQARRERYWAERAALPVLSLWLLLTLGLVVLLVLDVWQGRAWVAVYP